MPFVATAITVLLCLVMIGLGTYLVLDHLIETPENKQKRKDASKKSPYSSVSIFANPAFWVGIIVLLIWQIQNPAPLSEYAPGAGNEDPLRDAPGFILAAAAAGTTYLLLAVYRRKRKIVFDEEQPTVVAELAEPEQPWNFLFSTPWWSIACLLFCFTFLGLGMDSLSSLWNVAPSDSIWTGVCGFFGLLMMMFGLFSMFCSLLRVCGVGKQYRRPTRWKHVGKLVGFSFVFLMMGIMIPQFRAAIHEVGEAAARQQAEIALDEPWTEHQLPDGLFSFHAPSNWKAVDSEASLNRFADKVSGLGVAIYFTPKIDMTAKSLSDVQDVTLNNLKLNGIEIENVRKEEVGAQVDRLFQDMMILIVSNNVKSQIFMRQIDFQDHWLTVFFECRPSAFKDNISTILQIADTVWYAPQHDYILTRYDGDFSRDGLATPYPMRLFFLNNQNGSVSGVMNWPANEHAGTKFKGTISGSDLTLSEYEIFAGSQQVVVPVEYKGTITKTEIVGTATHKDISSSYTLELVDSPY